MYNLPMSTTLTEDYIQSIVESENLVIRNLQVTQGYYRLSQGMKRCMSGTNVNWCSFATHASKTAGQALRHESMPRFLRSAMIRLAGFENTFLFLNEGIEAHSHSSAGEHESRLGEALRRLSQLVSDGNITVFRELVWPFASYITTFKKDWVYDKGKLQAFLDKNLQPGPLQEGGQDYLIEAFTAVANANPAEKADLLSASISVAMNTTAFGLITAIPLLVTHSVLTAKTGEIVDSLEMASVKVLNLITALTKRNVTA